MPASIARTGRKRKSRKKNGPYSRSYSKIKTVAGSAKQNMEGFGFLGYNLHRLGLTVREDAVHGLRVLDSSLGHSYSGAIWDGQISFDALAYAAMRAIVQLEVL